ncbi:4'-phosphopantetheinyl transferase family protein [Methylomonas albis]|nr:4'-phosphopantetheinyl transferase superfamily protein [Methylomonas albis]
MLNHSQYLLPSPPFYGVSHNKPCTLQALHPEELPLINGASVKRIGEFCAGRYCAHQVLEQLGFSHVPVLKNEHGAPVWPKGIVGSISHSSEMSIAVAARSEDIQALGVDIQYYDRPFPDQTFATLFRHQEIRSILSAQRGLADRFAYSIFASKESVIKCIYNAFGYWLDFTDILIEIDLTRGWFLISIPKKRAFNRPGWFGRVYFDTAYISTATWLTHSK